jgi:methionine synthase reductase
MVEVHVLYGSQTGNAESIAEDLHGALSMRHKGSLLKLNDAKGKQNIAEQQIFIIICSTTGDGDVPENAEAWWRSVKLRSVAADNFKNIHFAVLGMGDTNYDKFCFMGKSIDKRLPEIGGHRFLNLRCADEVSLYSLIMFTIFIDVTWFYFVHLGNEYGRGGR